MEPPSAPMVFQCGGCRRVISDSNQLLSAVAELDALVVDAAIGVSAEAPETSEFFTLRCSSCKHDLGRRYKAAPSSSLDDIVHRPEAPRLCLTRLSLECYVLGSANQASIGDNANGMHCSDHQTASSPGALVSTGGHVEGRVQALERTEADVREQLAQLMRVVLALDQRLRSLEGDGDGSELGGERKRAR